MDFLTAIVMMVAIYVHNKQKKERIYLWWNGFYKRLGIINEFNSSDYYLHFTKTRGNVKNEIMIYLQLKKLFYKKEQGDDFYFPSRSKRFFGEDYSVIVGIF